MTIDIAAVLTDDLIARFEARYEVDPDGGCWEWAAGLNDYGYGVIGRRVNGKNVTLRAHRLSYTIHVGPIPDGLQIDHLCRNRGCVNPLHLEPVTNRVNSRRGQGACGMNARVTCCPKGHPYNEANTIHTTTSYGTPGRDCRACNTARQRRQRVVPGGVPCTVCGLGFATSKGMALHRTQIHRTAVTS